jgi:hypothetical protein
MLCLQANWGASGNGSAKHVAGGELRDVEFLDDLWGLGAFASAWRAGNDETVAELLILGRHPGGQETSSRAGNDTACESDTLI